MALNSPDFLDPNLAVTIEKLSPEVVDALLFGAIRLNEQGTVQFYSESERRLSGYTETTLGRSFFAEIAPCMDDVNFRGRIDNALRAGKVNISFTHVGDFDDATKVLDVRVQSASDGGCWIFIKRR